MRPKLATRSVLESIAGVARRLGLGTSRRQTGPLAARIDEPRGRAAPLAAPWAEAYVNLSCTRAA